MGIPVTVLIRACYSNNHIRLHAKICKDWFVSEWQAGIDALDAATDLGYPLGNLHVPASQSTAPRDRPLRTCSLNMNVQLYLGLDDEIKAHPIEVPHESLSGWLEKPWRLRSTRKARVFGDPVSETAVLISDSGHASTMCLAGAGCEAPAFEQPIQFEPDNVPAPHWGQLHRVCHQPKILRLNQDWFGWLEIEQEAWQEHIVPMATLLKLILFTMSLLQSSPGCFGARNVMPSLNMPGFFQLNLNMRLQQFQATTQGALRHCEVAVGAIALTGEGPAFVPHATSIVVEGFPVEDDVDDNSSFMAAGSRSREVQSNPNIMDHPDLVHQPEHDHPEDDMEEHSSDAASFDDVWHSGMVFSAHAQPAEGPLNTEFHDVLCRNVARLAQFPAQELVAAHYVPYPYPPRDLEARGLQVYLAQRTRDVNAGSGLPFILADVEFHPPAPSWQMVRVRCPIYVMSPLSRHQILRVMDVFDYSQFVNDLTMVWHNHELLDPEPRIFGMVITSALPYHLRNNHCLAHRPGALLVCYRWEWLWTTWKLSTGSPMWMMILNMVPTRYSVVSAVKSF